jgi:hypothetical protein
MWNFFPKNRNASKPGSPCGVWSRRLHQQTFVNSVEFHAIVRFGRVDDFEIFCCPQKIEFWISFRQLFEQGLFLEGKDASSEPRHRLSSIFCRVLSPSSPCCNTAAANAEIIPCVLVKFNFVKSYVWFGLVKYFTKCVFFAIVYVWVWTTAIVVEHE